MNSCIILDDVFKEFNNADTTSMYVYYLGLSEVSKEVMYCTVKFPVRFKKLSQSEDVVGCWVVLPETSLKIMDNILCKSIQFRENTRW